MKWGLKKLQVFQKGWTNKLTHNYKGGHKKIPGKVHSISLRVKIPKLFVRFARKFSVVSEMMIVIIVSGSITTIASQTDFFSFFKMNQDIDMQWF